MAFKSFVEETRKTNKVIEKLQSEKKPNEKNIIDLTQTSIEQNNGKQVENQETTQIEKVSFPEQKETKDYSIQRPQTFDNKLPSQIPKVERTQIPKQNIDSRHCNLIVNAIRKSQNTFHSDTDWQHCKYLKECEGFHYCTEFQSYCGKEKCTRATK
jgi:hypothetical protein